MTRRALAFFIFLLASVLPTAVLAQDPSLAAPADVPFWKELVAQLLPIAGAVLMAFAALAVRKLNAKYGLELDDRADATIRKALRGLIIGAEEWAAREMKTGVKPDGAAKLKRVLDLASGLFPNLDQSKLKSLVDEELARVPGVGATGHSHVAPKAVSEGEKVDSAPESAE